MLFVSACNESAARVAWVSSWSSFPISLTAMATHARLICVKRSTGLVFLRWASSCSSWICFFSSHAHVLMHFNSSSNADIFPFVPRHLIWVGELFLHWWRACPTNRQWWQFDECNGISCMHPVSLIYWVREPWATPYWSRMAKFSNL